MLRFVIVLCCWLTSQVAYGCYSMPENLARPASSLVQEARAIVWVLVVGVKLQDPLAETNDGRLVRFDVKVLETLKGKPSKRFFVDGKIDADGDQLLYSTRDNHKGFNSESTLGTSGTEGGSSPGGCNKRALPDLLLGGRYLIFLGGPPDSKDFERVESDDDEWLRVVRTELLKLNDKRPKGPPISRPRSSGKP
jgi:hypothetical protein